MATLKQFLKEFKQYEDCLEHYSNINVRAHCDCPNCGANLLLQWHFYPESLLHLGKGAPNGGFSFMGVEFYRKPDGEVVYTELWQKSRETRKRVYEEGRQSQAALKARRMKLAKK